MNANGWPEPQEPHGTAKLKREIVAFERLLPELMKDHCGQFVAVHDGKVVASGADRFEVSREASRLLGNIDLFIGKVTAEPERLVRLGARGLVEV